MSKLRVSTTWIIFLLVVLAAGSTLLPLGEPEIPGSLHLAVLEGPGPSDTERALKPFCDYLSRALGLNTQAHAVRAAELILGAKEAEILLGPIELMPKGEGYEVLAWVKGPGLRAEHERPYAVYPADSLWLRSEMPRVILGDPWTWAGGAGTAEYLEERGRSLAFSFSTKGAGHNAYDHLEAISAMAHGAYDLALARESDVKRALDMGLVDRERFRLESAGSPRGGFALVASPRLSDASRRQVRAAALNLDAYRFDPLHLMAASALSGLRSLGIEGFVPDRVFPNLRP